MGTVRVSGIQMRVSPELQINLERILGHIEAADSDFLLFPEMSLTGYHGDFDEQATRAAWTQIAAACKRSGVTAIVGTGAKEDRRTFIQSRIFGNSGRIVGTHEKMVPTDGDRLFCTPGKELRVFTHRGLSFGCLICNDLWVTPGCGPYPDPRLACKLGKMGARVIFHAIHSGSSAIHTPYHESNLVLRAMESRVFIVTANAAVRKGGVNATTGVISPEGKWLVRCPRRGEQSYSITLEL